LSSPSGSSVKDALSKTTAANIGALVVICGAVAYALWTKDVEVLKSLALVAAGYLFGRSSK